MAGINRTFIHQDSGLEVLVHVYFEVDPPKVHVALRHPGEATWGPPLTPVHNQDQPEQKEPAMNMITLHQTSNVMGSEMSPTELRIVTQQIVGYKPVVGGDGTVVMTVNYGNVYVTESAELLDELLTKRCYWQLIKDLDSPPVDPDSEPF